MGRYPYYLVWAVRSFPGEELIRALYAEPGRCCWPSRSRCTPTG